MKANTLPRVRISLSPPKNPRSSERGFFYPIRRIGMASARPARCMELRRSRVWHRAKRVSKLVFLRIDSIHHFVMIPFAPSSRFHTATSCGFHTRLWRDLDAESAPNPRTDSNRHTVGVGASTTRKTPHKRAVVGASPYRSKFMCKAIDWAAFWTDSDLRNG